MLVRRWLVQAGASSLEQMVLQKAARPKPGPEEVRVKVVAASPNLRDELLLTGRLQRENSDFMPLADGAGEVDAVASGVTGWSIGDRVIGNYFTTWRDELPAPGPGSGLGSPGQDGMLTRYALLKADRMTAIPKSLSFDEAACLPCAR